MVVQVKQGHVLDVLASLPAKSVHVAVTSPPYWGLRAYGTPPQVWGGADGCEHVWGDPIVDHKRGADAGPSAQAGNTVARVCPPTTQQGVFCRRCGAWCGELGSEPTLDLFVAHLVAVFAAVGRVLRDDGTLWVNLGDSYASKPNSNTSPRAEQGNGSGVFRVPAQHHLDARWEASREKPPYAKSGLKDGDLCMAPARFALAMQASGWRLRSEITLCKTSPMPESVQGARWERCRVKVKEGNTNGGRNSAAPTSGWTRLTHPDSPLREVAEWADCPGCPRCAQTDGLVQRWGSGRPTSATEKLFVFAKGTGSYYYDLEAVRVANSAGSIERFGKDARMTPGPKYEHMAGQSPAGMNATEWRGNGRNLWNYVMWSPEPLAAAHYAAYPRWLPRLAIQAGTSEAGVCPGCQAPWLRVVERRDLGLRRSDADFPAYDGVYDAQRPDGWRHRKRRVNVTAEYGKPGSADLPPHNAATVGWRQSCRCPAHSPVPATVLDCFSGSGTTLIEANALGRHGLGIELQEEYVQIAHKRLSGQPLSLFAHEGAAEFAGAEVEVAAG